MAEYIERGALLNKLKERDLCLCVTEQDINDAPAADVAQVRHGLWCWEGRFKACSICGSYVEFTETLGASHWKYCPYCGARMDLEVTNDS